MTFRELLKEKELNEGFGAAKMGSAKDAKEFMEEIEELGWSNDGVDTSNLPSGKVNSWRYTNKDSKAIIVVREYVKDKDWSVDIDGYTQGSSYRDWIKAFNKLK